MWLIVYFNWNKLDFFYQIHLFLLASLMGPVLCRERIAADNNACTWWLRPVVWVEWERGGDTVSSHPKPAEMKTHSSVD